MLKYDDPEKYQGPIVQEWPPSKNRSVPLYIKGETLKTLLHQAMKFLLFS